MSDSRKRIHQSHCDLSHQLPKQLGIWRLGNPIHVSNSFVVAEAQPIDAAESPRWDYVAKFGTADLARQAVERSIASGSELGHPNIVAVLDGDPVAELPFLVMPKLDGQTMAARLRDDGRKPLPVALWLIRQLCQALESVHAAGWTHGDVKPENIMVAENGHVTLLDFGFARRGSLTALASFEGTPEYAAPELLVNASLVSPASDLFAVGRILWAWLARVETSNEAMLSPVCELVERLVEQLPTSRPTAFEATQVLLRLEIDSLGEHIGPQRNRHAA